MSNPLKKTMVYLGLADEEEVYDETPAPAPTRKSAAASVEKAAPVTPIHRPAVVRQPAVGALNEIVTVHPKQYRDAQVIAESFREAAAQGPKFCFCLAEIPSPLEPSFTPEQASCFYSCSSC